MGRDDILQALEAVELLIFIYFISLERVYLSRVLIFLYSFTGNLYL